MLLLSVFKIAEGKYGTLHILSFKFCSLFSLVIQFCMSESPVGVWQGVGQSNGQSQLATICEDLRKLGELTFGELFEVAELGTHQHQQSNIIFKLFWTVPLGCTLIM